MAATLHTCRLPTGFKDHALYVPAGVEPKGQAFTLCGHELHPGSIRSIKPATLDQVTCGNCRRLEELSR